MRALRAPEVRVQASACGRSRPGQEYIWALQMWLAEAPYSDLDPRGIPRKLIERVNAALGQHNAQKTLLVSALLARLLLKADRRPLPPEWAPFWEQLEATDICHYAFPDNLERRIEAMGRPLDRPRSTTCAGGGLLR